MTTPYDVILDFRKWYFCSTPYRLKFYINILEIFIFYIKSILEMIKFKENKIFFYLIKCFISTVHEYFFCEPNYLTFYVEIFTFTGEATEYFKACLNIAASVLSESKLFLTVYLRMLRHNIKAMNGKHDIKMKLAYIWRAHVVFKQ